MKRFAALFAIAGVAGCSPLDLGFEDLECPPLTLSVLKGNNQTASAGAELAERLEVAVNGSTMFCAVLGLEITWTVESGGGTVTAGQRPAESSWVARWTLGPMPGKQRVRATWVNGTGQPPFVIFEATAIE